MPQPVQSRVCPHCKFEYRSRQGRCWLCGQPLPPIDQAPLAATAADGSPLAAPPVDADVAINPYAAPPANVVGGWTFGLSSLFLVVTLAAVCMGVIALAPGLGGPLLIVVVLALIRTSAVARRQSESHALTTGEKIAAFAGSVGIAILIMFAAGIAFFCACWAACFGAAAVNGGDLASISVGLGVGALAAVVLTVVLFRMAWPKRRVPKEPKGPQ